MFLVAVMCLLLIRIHVYFAGYAMRSQTVGCWYLYISHIPYGLCLWIFLIVQHTPYYMCYITTAS